MKTKIKIPAGPQPLVQVRSDYEESLARYVQAVNMLVSTCEVLLSIPGTIAPKATAKLRHHVERVNDAWVGK